MPGLRDLLQPVLGRLAAADAPAGQPESQQLQPGQPDLLQPGGRPDGVSLELQLQPELPSDAAEDEQVCLLWGAASCAL